MRCWRQRAASVGIDITPDAVRLLQCRRSDHDGMWGFQHAHESLPPGVVVAQRIADSKAVGAAIARAMLRSRMHARKAVVALASPAVRLRLLSVPSGLTRADLETRLELEAARIQPAAGSPLHMDFHMDFAVQDKGVNSPGEVRVLLAVADPEVVQGRVAAVKAGGLAVAAVDLEALALARALRMLTGQSRSLDQILALGRDSAQLPGLGDHLTRRFPVQALPDDLPAWLLACGLALYGGSA